MSAFDYRRRPSTVTHIGPVNVGGDNPVRLQSMNNTSTTDIPASVEQCIRIAEAGADINRLTAQGEREAHAMGEIRRELRERGCAIPLVADIHFNPRAAFAAATEVEKVRINPGNFFDPGRKFLKMEFTDEEYAAELARIKEKLIPFLDLCHREGTAIRIGVNHGSLSDRIMSRYGDGAEGMVESALEFMRICRDYGFDNVVVSIKASDVFVMADTVRLLAESMDKEGIAYPIHLGVTEAGNAREGRIKSAVGIGSLLSDGIGDTIRVSLSEAPEHEIPVARQIADYADANARANYENGTMRRSRLRRSTVAAGEVPADAVRMVFDGGCRLSDARKAVAASDKPVVAVMSYPEIGDRDMLIVAASIDLGSLLLDGDVAGVELQSPLLSEAEAADVLHDILQATGIARFKAEIVACPGCGRTLYELPEVLDSIKNTFGHLKHLKIAVMGCIVNGPGEMAGADYGYVGGGPQKISLYRGTECVVKNIPQEEAVGRLKELLMADGQWYDKDSGR